MKSEKAKVFLIVTIPTHLRILMTVADLLKADGRYLPYLVYHPSAVYDQNHEHCAEASHPVFVWRNHQFEAIAGAVDPQAVDSAGPAHSSEDIPTNLPVPVQAAGRWSRRLGTGLKKILFHGFYHDWSRRYRCLPSPHKIFEALKCCVRYLFMIRATMVVVVRYLFMTRAVIGLLMRTMFSGKIPVGSSSAKKIFFQQVFLQAFDAAWTRESRSVSGRSGLAARLERHFADGIFGGIWEQKKFYTALCCLLDKEAPQRLILPEENLFYNSHLIVHAAHARRIPVLIVPFRSPTVLSGPKPFMNGVNSRRIGV